MPLWCLKLKNFQSTRIQCILSRWFRYESETNRQPIKFNFDVDFCRPVLPRNQSSTCIIRIWDLCILNLYSLWQSWSNYIRKKPHQGALHIIKQITRTHFLQLQPSIRPVPAQVILLWKVPPNFPSNVTLYPCECSHQNHLVTAKRFYLSQGYCEDQT